MSACEIKELVVTVQEIECKRRQCQWPPNAPQHTYGSTCCAQHQELVNAKHRVLVHDVFLHKCLQEKFHLRSRGQVVGGRDKR